MQHQCIVKVKWSLDTCEMTDTVFQSQGAILLWQTYRQNCQDADMVDQKVKWFVNIHKIYKHLWETYLQLSFLPIFIHVHVLQIFRFSPPENGS